MLSSVTLCSFLMHSVLLCSILLVSVLLCCILFYSFQLLHSFWMQEHVLYPRPLRKAHDSSRLITVMNCLSERWQTAIFQEFLCCSAVLFADTGTAEMTECVNGNAVLWMSVSWSFMCVLLTETQRLLQPVRCEISGLFCNYRCKIRFAWSRRARD